MGSVPIFQAQYEEGLMIRECTECGGQMQPGVARGLTRLQWVPLDAEKKGRLRLVRTKKIRGWACDQCGVIQFRVMKEN